MVNRHAFLVLVPVFLAVGCTTQQQMLQQKQGIALDTALRRGRFELSCPEATAEVLSSNVIEPVAMRVGYERSEYTVGVSGCGKKSTYIVMCPQTSDACEVMSGENRSFRDR